VDEEVPHGDCGIHIRRLSVLLRPRLSTFAAFPLDFAKSRMQSYDTTFTATVALIIGTFHFRRGVLSTFDQCHCGPFDSTGCGSPLRVDSTHSLGKIRRQQAQQTGSNTAYPAAAAHAGPMAEASWLPQDANFHLSPYLEQQDTRRWQQQNHARGLVSTRSSQRILVATSIWQSRLRVCQLGHGRGRQVRR